MDNILTFSRLNYSILFNHLGQYLPLYRQSKTNQKAQDKLYRAFDKIEKKLLPKKYISNCIEEISWPVGNKLQHNDCIIALRFLNNEIDKKTFENIAFGVVIHQFEKKRQIEHLLEKAAPKNKSAPKTRDKSSTPSTF